MSSYTSMFETALTAEKRLLSLAQTRQELDAQRATILSEDPPPAPVCPTLAPPMEPTIETKVKFNIWLAVIPPVALILLLGIKAGLLPAIAWAALYYFVFYKMRKTKEEDTVRATAAFQQEQAAKAQEFERGQAVVNERHAMEMERYRNETLPAFAAQKQARLDEMDDHIRKTDEEITATAAELAAFYEQVGIIPEAYRNVDALEYMRRVSAKGDVEPQQLYTWYEESLQQQRDEEMRKQQQHKEMLKNVALFAAGAAASAAVYTVATSKPPEPTAEDIASGKGRQNLFGSHLCTYNRNHSCLGCKVSGECTQHGRYKLGS